jgi:peptidoglycan/xylan/chitin deacetylase (PgdA/CDA1 family)
MRRVIFSLIASLALTLTMGFAAAGTAVAAPGDQVIQNPGAEDGVTVPANWNFRYWSTNIDLAATSTWSTAAPHSGTHSLIVTITARPNDGDAKWLPDPVAVKGGAYYTLTDWYKSDVTTSISVEYWTTAAPPSIDDAGGTWINLQARIAPASTWTQFTTDVAMPPDATYATFAQVIATPGSLETDDYAMTEEATPAGFSTPLISLTFDDGTESFNQTAWPLLSADGFRSTLYIPSSFVDTSGYLTSQEVSQLAGDGNEIGSHSFTHPPDLTAPNVQLNHEIADSKGALEAIPGVGAGQVTSFAYPFGFYDDQVVAAVKAAGYTSGRSVEVGYNNALDLQPFDIRVQNMTSTTTQAEFQTWVDYAKAHNYWLVIVYHKALPDTPTPTLGPYDITASMLQAQLAYISSSGLGSDVVTVTHALADIYPPTAGTVAIAPESPSTNATLTATPSGFTDYVHSPLTYVYTWKFNGSVVPGETGATLDLSKAGNGDHGDTVSVEVSGRDQWGNSGVAADAQVVVANTAPTSGSVTIVPSPPQAGKPLTATPTGFADADGDALTYHYTWFHNGQLITGATSATLPGSAVVAGETVAVQVAASDGDGATSPVATAAVTVPAASGGNTVPLTVTVTSPTVRYYRIGSMLLVKYACTGGSGVTSCMASLGPMGDRTSSVTSGKRIRLSRAGRYVLRIFAEDTRGNTMTKTVNINVTADRTGPSIKVLSPKATTYRVGRVLHVRFTASDPIGVASTSATLGPVGSKASTVTSGKTIQLSKSGRYVLRITARDSVGNGNTKTLYFSVK